VQKQRRIGIIGGTFDPIHHGHLVAASEVQSRFELDEVVFVPTGQPYQKGPVSPAEDRYLMTVIATASNPRFQVSRADVDRDGPTYTVDTLRDLSAVFGPSADLAAARRFAAEVDAAAVLVNASTRFTDGGEFGFGAEIGISTQKLHARGPMGLTEMTSTKYVVTGDGHVR